MAAGGIEAIPFGVLVFVAGSLLAANAWAVVDAKVAISASAREAARAYVEAPDPASASERAHSAARETVAGHGRDPHAMSLELVHEAGSSWGRCSRITARATYTVPATSVPWIGGWGDGIEVASSHSEVVDPFRAGLPGAAGCS